MEEDSSLTTHLHHGVGHCKRDITSWTLPDYSFSLIQTYKGEGWITDFAGCFYHITVGYMFGSNWEEIPCKGQRWIALTSFSEPNFTQRHKSRTVPWPRLTLTLRCSWYIWWHHKLLWTTEKSVAGILCHQHMEPVLWSHSWRWC